MPVYKRNSSKYYYIKFQIDGQTIQQSSKTENRQEAEHFEAKLKKEYWENKRLGAPLKYTWKEAVVRYVSEKQHKKSLHDDILMLRVLSPFLEDSYLQDINRELIETVLHQVQAQRGISDSRVNRYASLVRGILNLAYREWGWLPTPRPLRFRREADKRVRWITKEEASRLIFHAPEHLKRPIKFSLATGLRKQNVLSLKWEQVDYDRRTAWIHADESKGKRDISVPLNRTALECLGTPKNAGHVFLYRRRPINQVSTETWGRICRAANISAFRWHDLRHTWASWHVMNGTSLNELMELGGWSSIKMVLKYAHLSSDHLKSAADNIGDF